MADVEIDLVKRYPTHARFFREGNKDLVEISMTGNPDTLIKKVTPEIMAEYRDAWDAYCDGVPLKQRVGTPLTTLPNVSEERAAEFVRRNVHNLEELAALNDHQCQGLGHGVLTLRKAARDHVALHRFKQKQEAEKRIGDAVSAAPPAPETVALEEVVKSQGEQIAQIGAAVERIAQLLAAKPKKRGVPKNKHGAPVATLKRTVTDGSKLNPGDNEPSV